MQLLHDRVTLRNGRALGYFIGTPICLPLKLCCLYSLIFFFSGHPQREGFWHEERKFPGWEEEEPGLLIAHGRALFLGSERSPLPTPDQKLLELFLGVTYLRRAAWPGIKVLETVLVPSKLDS